MVKELTKVRMIPAIQKGRPKIRFRNGNPALIPIQNAKDPINKNPHFLSRVKRGVYFISPVTTNAKTKNVITNPPNETMIERNRAAIQSEFIMPSIFKAHNTNCPSKID